MTIIDCQQGTAEWFYARLGKVTASELCDALRFLKRGEKKGEESQTRADYRAALVSEMLTGEPSDTFVSKYMKYGTEMEPIARAAYEMKHDVMVETVGFGIHGTIDRFGASPDGLIGINGGLEIKVPKTDTHVKYMFAQKLPPEYEPQVMANIMVFEREWWDFMSFDPRMPKRHQIFVKRVYRDEQRIAEIEDGVRQFLCEVDGLIASLEKLNPEIELTQAERVFGKDYKSNPELYITEADLPPWARSNA